MVVLKGKSPSTQQEMWEVIRNVGNGMFCFYDDLSPREQRKLDGISFLGHCKRKILIRFRNTSTNTKTEC